MDIPDPYARTPRGQKASPHHQGHRKTHFLVRTPTIFGADVHDPKGCRKTCTKKVCIYFLAPISGRKLLQVHTTKKPHNKRTSIVIGRGALVSLLGVCFSVGTQILFLQGLSHSFSAASSLFAAGYCTLIVAQKQNCLETKNYSEIEFGKQLRISHSSIKQSFPEHFEGGKSIRNLLPKEWEPFLLTVGAVLLTVKLLCLQFPMALIRCTLTL